MHVDHGGQPLVSGVPLEDMALLPLVLHGILTLHAMHSYLLRPWFPSRAGAAAVGGAVGGRVGPAPVPLCGSSRAPPPTDPQVGAALPGWEGKPVADRAQAGAAAASRVPAGWPLHSLCCCCRVGVPVHSSPPLELHQSSSPGRLTWVPICSSDWAFDDMLRFCVELSGE